MAELDLNIGDEARADAISARERRRQNRSGGSSTKSATSGTKSNAGKEPDVEAQLRIVLDRMAEQRESRGDDELAEAITETRDSIVSGFMSVTRTIAPLRAPLVFVLAVAEPILAFWKVGHILGGRWYERRRRRAEEAQRQAAAQDGSGVYTQDQVFTSQ